MIEISVLLADLSGFTTMTRELGPVAFRGCLEVLHASWVPLSASEARLQMEPPPSRRPFTQAVQARLAELRALDELTRHLHGVRKAPPPT